MAAQIRLVTRGDDSGSCNSANVAIWNAYKKGILHNTSLMVPTPCFPEAAAMFSEDPGLCVGLHITLTAEWDEVRWGPVLPVERVSSLVDPEGHFFQTGQALNANDPDPDEMIAEVQAQLELAREHGVDIRYLDTHMGIGWIKGVQERFRALGEREGIPLSHDVVHRLPDVEDDFENPVEAMIARLDAAEPGTYLTVVHPAYDRSDARMLWHEGMERGATGPSRDWQRRAFMDPDVLDCCSRNGVTPIRYDEI